MVIGFKGSSLFDPRLSDALLYGDLDILFGAEITLGGLDGRVPEQKLDLFQAAAILPAQLGAGAPGCVTPQEANWSRFNSSWVTCPYKRRNFTSVVSSASVRR